MEEKSGNSEGKRIKSMLRRRLILAILSAGIEPWERKSRVSDRFPAAVGPNMQKPRRTWSTSRFSKKLVEAAGVEPASENRFLADLHA